MKNYKNNLYKFPLSLYLKDIEIETDLNLLMSIDNQCFEDKLRTSADELKEFFDDEYSFGSILYQDGKAIGYYSAAFEDIEDEDSELNLLEVMKEEADTCHMYNISIIPEFRSIITLDYMAHECFFKAKQLEYDHITSTSRVKTGLSRLFKQRYGGKILKRYENWENYGEPFDFMYFNIKRFPFLPKPIRSLFNLLRRVRRILIKIKLIKPLA
jgi:hypothetical protein